MMPGLSYLRFLLGLSMGTNKQEKANLSDDKMEVLQNLYERSL